MHRVKVLLNCIIHGCMNKLTEKTNWNTKDIHIGVLEDISSTIREKEKQVKRDEVELDLRTGIGGTQKRTLKFHFKIIDPSLLLYKKGHSFLNFIFSCVSYKVLFGLLKTTFRCQFTWSYYTSLRSIYASLQFDTYLTQWPTLTLLTCDLFCVFPWMHFKRKTRMRY